jgi:hypothetical protein
MPTTATPTPTHAETPAALSREAAQGLLGAVQALAPTVPSTKSIGASTRPPWPSGGL